MDKPLPGFFPAVRVLFHPFIRGEETELLCAPIPGKMMFFVNICYFGASDFYYWQRKQHTLTDFPSASSFPNKV
jgi:hypothetical protein